MKKIIKLSTVLFILTILLVACNKTPKENDANEGKPSNEASPNNETEGNNENKEGNTTVKIFFPWGEELFEERVGPIDERLKNIDIELVEHKEGSTEGLAGAVEAYAAEKIVPDIIVMGGNDITDDYLADIVYPLDDLIAKYGFDLSLMNKSIVDTIRAVSNDNKVIAIPNSNDYVVLYYNKEIFDKFGVDYPSDDMSWDEVLELSKAVTGEKDSVAYRGLDIRGAGRYPLEQRAVNLTDPETGDVLIAQEQAVKQWFDLVEEIYGAHGNFPDPWEDGLADGLNDFINGRVAMALASPQFMRWGLSPEIAEKIDFAAAPYWDDLPNQAAPAKSHYYWVINEFSENKDAAFEVLVEYLSEETQGQLTRGGQEMTVLADDSMKLEFGSELANFEAKNIAGIFAHKPANPPEQISKWDKYVELNIDTFLLSDDDTNTFIRKLQDKSETAIKEAQNE